MQVVYVRFPVIVSRVRQIIHVTPHTHTHALTNLFAVTSLSFPQTLPGKVPVRLQLLLRMTDLLVVRRR